MKPDTSILSKSFKKVFKQPKYILLAVVISLIILTISIWLPNLNFLTTSFFSEKLSLEQKINFAVSFLGAFRTNFTNLSRLVTIILSTLTGINIALLIFYLKTRVSFEKEAGVSLGGMILGLVGIGCASCGSIILSTIFGVSAATGLLIILPLKGQEIGFLGIAILLYSIYLLLIKIEKPNSCKVKVLTNKPTQVSK